jgi:predicted Zn-dependent protease
MSTIPREKMIFDDRLVSVLLMTGRLNDIIDIAKARIELDPTNPQHKLTLAAAYLQANRRSEAVAAIQQIIKENPSFKDQGEYYIKEIQAGRNP